MKQYCLYKRNSKLAIGTLLFGFVKIIFSKKSIWGSLLTVYYFERLIYFFYKNHSNKLIVISIFINITSLIAKPINKFIIIKYKCGRPAKNGANKYIKKS